MLRAIRPFLLLSAVIPVVCRTAHAAEVERAAAEAVIAKALDAKSPVGFKEVPLKDVADFLEDRHKIEIVLDSRALDDLGIGGDTPVTLKLEHASLRTVLELILHELDLTYRVRHEVLLITSPEAAEANPRIEVYDVLDLVDRGEDVPAYGSRYDYDTLIEMTTSMVRPTSWQDAGGAGAVEGALGTLVVSQTHQVHEQISLLLAAVEKGRKSKPGDVLRLARLGSEPPADALDRPVKLDFTDTPLDDAVQYLGGLVGVDTHIDARSLSDVGLDLDTPVSARLKDVALKTALREMLHTLDLTWMWVDNVLVVTTPEQAESRQIVRLYNVRDLVLPEGADADNSAQDFDTLIELMYDLIAPTSWDITGGSATMMPYKQLLVVAQTHDGHNRIDTLLKRLRVQGDGDQGEGGTAESIRQVLLQKTDAEFIDTPLSDVLAFLADKHDISIQTDRRSLGDEGVDPDETLVTLQVSGVSLRSVLAFVLAGPDLTWIPCDEGFIVITTPEEAQNRLLYRFFDVSDLIVDEVLSMEGLIELLTTSVAPETWVDAGGPGTMAAFRDRLAVVQTPQVQDEIENLLKKLKAVKGSRAKP